MKQINFVLFLIWVGLLAIGLYWSWNSFQNAQTLVGGGYLYSDNGEVSGMYDTWGLANYPHWIYPVFAMFWVLFRSPIWWMIPFWSIGGWLGIYYFVLLRTDP